MIKNAIKKQNMRFIFCLEFAFIAELMGFTYIKEASFTAYFLCLGFAFRFAVRLSFTLFKFGEHLIICHR